MGYELQGFEGEGIFASASIISGFISDFTQNMQQLLLPCPAPAPEPASAFLNRWRRN